MSEKGRKILKTTGKVLLWTFAVILVVLLALPLWIGPVARGVANWQAPKITGCKFNLGTFGLNQYSGELLVGDMQLANPPECGEGNCVELGKFYVDVEMTTLPKQVIHVTKVEIDGITISTTPTAANFRKILANIKGEPEKEQKGSMLSRLGDDQAKPEKPEAESEAEKSADSGKRFVIDKFIFKDFRLNIGIVPIILPNLEIDGIGADKAEGETEPQGATFSEVCTKVFEAVMNAIGAVGGAIGDLGKGAANLVGAGAGAAMDGAGKAASAIGDGAGAAAGAVMDGAGKAASAIGDGASKAAGAVMGIFKSEE